MTSKPGATTSTPLAENLNTAYLSLTLAVNVISALLISGRLLSYRYKFKEFLGQRHTKTYTTVAAILIESASLYVVTGLLLLVFFAIGSELVVVFLPLHGLMQVSKSHSHVFIMGC